MKITTAAANYVKSVRSARSENTARAYERGIDIFLRVLDENWINPQSREVDALSEDAITWLSAELKGKSVATERLYTSAVIGFYEYLEAERLLTVNLSRLKLLVKQRGRRQGERFPDFPKAAIEKVLEFARRLPAEQNSDTEERLRALRDRAFLFTLADTGLRIHEACNLVRGEVDLDARRAVIIGKGDKQATIRFSERAIVAIRDYLHARKILDGASGTPLVDLPLFTRHDFGAGEKIKGLGTSGGRFIVDLRTRQALGKNPGITPHSFRHYFVTNVLNKSGNLKLAQELARHTNIQVTQRYAHLTNRELDRGYEEIFD